MTLREKMRRLCKIEWSSMMIENAYHQGNEHKLYAHLSDKEHTIRSMMDASQLWFDTPQGDYYWRVISSRL